MQNTAANPAKDCFRLIVQDRRAIIAEENKAEREAITSRVKMRRDGSTFRSTSKLEVFAPQPSELDPAQRASEIRRLRRSRRRGKKNETGDFPTRLSPNRETASQSLASSESQTALPLNSDPVVQPVEASTFSVFGAVAALPSWLVSFMVHLALILILALWTWGAHQDQAIHLEIAEIGDSQFDSMTMQIEFEEATLEDSMDAMESPDVDETDMALEVELEETVPEIMDDATDPYAMTELPEFAMPTAKPNAGADAPGKQAMGRDAPQGSGTEFFGTKSYGSDFVFVIDASSSMMSFYRWNRAVRELEATLGLLDEDQNFLVLLYNNRAYMMFGAPTDQKLIPATKENKKKISQWLQAAQPFGGTEPGEAVRLALGKKPDAIYFLSDGELRDNTMFNLRFWNKAIKGADGLARKIPIHTILLGSNSGRLTMKTIAEENNGIFTSVN